MENAGRLWSLGVRVLIACEFSGVVRRAFRALGHNAWSCDLLPAEDGSPNHHQGDVLGEILEDGWDLMVAHPPCTRLTNAGVRWLHKPPRGRTLAEMWQELEDGCALYRAIRNAPIRLKAIENPVMHPHATERLGIVKRQVIQPHYFGDKFFKATGFELHGLPPLKRTHWLTLPKKGTDEHKKWSAVHRASPGPNRWKERSRTHEGIAKAMAEQWGGHARTSGRPQTIEEMREAISYHSTPATLE
jgi:hypothetical protein